MPCCPVCLGRFCAAGGSAHPTRARRGAPPPRLHPAACGRSQTRLTLAPRRSTQRGRGQDRRSRCPKKASFFPLGGGGGLKHPLARPPARPPPPPPTHTPADPPAQARPPSTHSHPTRRVPHLRVHHKSWGSGTAATAAADGPALATPTTPPTTGALTVPTSSPAPTQDAATRPPPTPPFTLKVHHVLDVSAVAGGSSGGGGGTATRGRGVLICPPARLAVSPFFIQPRRQTAMHRPPPGHCPHRRQRRLRRRRRRWRLWRRRRRRRQRRRRLVAGGARR